ncbi:winged helix-turn-helix domain-containing protein [Acidithiobacillus thiooxidans]
MALSTIYRMLARHGWQKLAPDTYHPQGDKERREVWEKTARSQSDADLPYTYAYAAVPPQDGRMDSLVLPEESSKCMQIFLNEVAYVIPMKISP